MVFDLLHPKLREAIKELGYLSPTPVQSAAIPVILSGAHVLIIAPTGFGKTEAALFPIFTKILESRSEGIKALYITPLRSLLRTFTSMRIAQNFLLPLCLPIFLPSGTSTGSLPAEAT